MLRAMSTIVVLSDTHDNKKAIKIALEKIAPIAPEYVLHCGDIVSPSTLELFRGLPFYSVLGNGDWDRAGLQSRAIENGMRPPETSLELIINNRKILVTHGDHANFLARAVNSQEFDFIFHGHSHQASERREGKTLILNPGALYRAATYTLLLLDTDTWEHTFVELSSIS